MISAMYIGVEIEAMPMPTPPMKRKKMNVQMSCGNAVRWRGHEHECREKHGQAFAQNVEIGPTSNTPVRSR